MTKKLSMDEFHKQGYLQELNRQFLHPLGLSLAIKVEDGKRTFYAFYDHRESKEDLLFEPGLLDPTKAKFVEREQEERGQVRSSRLGFVVQPIEP